MICHVFLCKVTQRFSPSSVMKYNLSGFFFFVCVWVVNTESSTIAKWTEHDACFFFFFWQNRFETCDVRFPSDGASYRGSTVQYWWIFFFLCGTECCCFFHIAYLNSKIILRNFTYSTRTLIIRDRMKKKFKKSSKTILILQAKSWDANNKINI